MATNFAGAADRVRGVERHERLTDGPIDGWDAVAAIGSLTPARERLKEREATRFEDDFRAARSLATFPGDT